MPETEVELRLFGSPRLRRQGREVQLHSRKTLALLGYMALEAGRDHPRSALAQLLWSGAESPRHNLRQALYSLRSSLGGAGEACLTSDRQTARLDPDDRVFVDALAIRAARDSQQLDLEQLARRRALRWSFHARHGPTRPTGVRGLAGRPAQAV